MHNLLNRNDYHNQSNNKLYKIICFCAFLFVSLVFIIYSPKIDQYISLLTFDSTRLVFIYSDYEVLYWFASICYQLPTLIVILSILYALFLLVQYYIFRLMKNKIVKLFMPQGEQLGQNNITQHNRGDNNHNNFIFEFKNLIFGHSKSFFQQYQIKYVKKALSGTIIIISLILGPYILTNEIFKKYWGRPRPRQVLIERQLYMPFWQSNFNAPNNNSFPSGHASIGFFAGIPFLATNRQKVGIITGCILGLLISIGRILQGGHYMSDCVFAGIFVVASYLIATRASQLIFSHFMRSR